MEHQIGQMTLEVGGEADAMIIGSYRVSGDLGAIAELPKGAQVRVLISDVDGEVISTSLGVVTQVAFKDQRKGGVVVATERKHTVKLET